MVLMDASTEQILRFIAESPYKVSFNGLKDHFCGNHPSEAKRLKQLVVSLIQSGHLSYTYHYGSSFIEVSYDQPQAVSPHIVLKPPQHSFNVLPGQWAVSLGRGASFGGGEHPSTRLAIQLIDELLHQPSWWGRRQRIRAIDIGTGSGVLAIVAAKIGAGFVRGIDCDPCAVFEARENVLLNQVDDRVEILNDCLDDITGFYDLVLANLRLPTLLDLRLALGRRVAVNSGLVFSGLKSEEVHAVGDCYQEAGFLTLRKRSEKGWSAICLVRGSYSGEGVDSITSY
jgi:ribosomal protein L11 methyltransferase